jgi:hypothetical protein
MDLSQYWAKDKWWLTEEYSRVWTYHGTTQEDVEDRINRVIEVFSPEWQQCTPPHPVLYNLLPQGLLPFQFLFNLGGNLRTVAKCLRIKHVIEDLRLPDNFESALLELGLAAHLKDKGHKIEFRPPLDTGKESDFSATYSEQKVFFEIKRMQPSNCQQAMDALGREVGFVASDIEFNFPHLAGKWFRIELDPYVADLMSGEPDADRPTIRSIVNDIRREVVSRAETHQAFEIPLLAKVTVVTERTESGVNWPMASCQEELKRFLRAHLQKAITQLHSDYPGVIVAQTPGLLDEDLTTRIIVGWLKESSATHVSSVVFLPVYNSMPMTWALFKPFAVVNEQAKFPAHDLQAFRDLAPLIRNEVAIPNGE